MSFIGDIFGGIGEFEEGESFSKAAALEKQNVSLEKQITNVNTSQEQRQVYQALGAESADTGAAGFRMMAGSKSLLNSSIYQGSLALQAIKTQGSIQENAYAAQASAYSGQAQMAEMSGAGKAASGIFSMFASFMSDERLKEDIERIGEHEPGIGIYKFRYKGHPEVYIGVMANEVDLVHPDCVDTDPDGFKFVNYEKLGLELRHA